MDNSLRALCDALKKIIPQLKPQSNQLSFIVMTGTSEQGKSALLKQSGMEELPVFSEEQIKVYYNAQGVIVELGESWLMSNNSLLQNTLKQINKCNRHLQITGLILCIDVSQLLSVEPMQLAELKKSHLQLLHRLGSNLGYQTELALMFTKMDSLAGFSEFYQMDHASDLSKPLGFSLDCVNHLPKKIQTFRTQFNQLVELQNQQVINKMHPARSTIKRSLIREFPLQLVSLYTPINALIQGISPKLFQLNSIYFTSAEQGGVSIDRLNKKIQHEYALLVQDTFPQATNYRSYFVDGALKNIQSECAQAPLGKNFSHKPPMAIAASIVAISLMILTHHYYKAANLLDEASKELLSYDLLAGQEKNGHQALYHLSNASRKIDRIASNTLSLPNMNQLKQTLHHSTHNKVAGEFLPSLAQELEQVITNPSNIPIVRYKALKIYLMFKQPEHFSAEEIEAWFVSEWTKDSQKSSKNSLALLEQTLSKPLPTLPINEQLISDTRNYLNALPTAYLYYSLAKEYFPQNKQKIAVEGFNLASNELPVYFTKAGYKDIMKRLGDISTTLEAEHWVLGRKDLSELDKMLTHAYSFDYLTWWQSFMKKSQPLRYQDYQQGRKIAHRLQKSDALSQLIELIQKETKPDLVENTSKFNEQIASKFADLNLISGATTKELSARIIDLERFISTLSVINDGGKTAFAISKTRFTNVNASDPVSLLYNQAEQLPEPLSTWTKQIAGDTWVILIKDCKRYINQQWEDTVYKDFERNIARRYPLDSSQSEEIAIADFNRFFATHGTLNTFTEQYIKPFLDTSNAGWKQKEVNHYVLPIANETIDEIIRANVITNMFFPNYSDESKIDFSLQKISLDPVVASLHLEIGNTVLMDNQGSESFIRFSWPQNNAKLGLDSIEGNHYELAEQGIWAIFKLLEKVNVLVDEQDSSNLQILFEVNSNSGRYQLKTNNQINPFTPGILNGFILNKAIV